VKDERPSVCSTNAFFVSISRRARASAQVLVFTRALRSGSGFAPTTSRPFGSRTSPRSFFDLAADRVPARSYRRSLPTTSLVSGRSRRARSPPPRVSLPRRRPTFFVGAPGARGCGPAATPVLSTDVCSSRILFSKTIASRLGTRRIVCSHTMRGLAVSRRNAHFGEPSDGAKVLSPSASDLVGVPLMLRRPRALPAERCPPASARDRHAISGRNPLA